MRYTAVSKHASSCFKILPGSSVHLWLSTRSLRIHQFGCGGPEPGACTCIDSKSATSTTLLAGRSIIGADVPSGLQPAGKMCKPAPSNCPLGQKESKQGSHGDSDIGRGQTAAAAAAEGRADRAHLDLRELCVR